MPSLFAALIIKATLLIAVAFLLQLFLRRAPAAVRHFAWTAMLASMLLLPVLEWYAPAVPVEAVWLAAAGTQSFLAAATAAPDASPIPFDPIRLAGWIWLGGFGLLLLHFGAGAAWIGRLRATGTPARDHRTLDLRTEAESLHGIRSPVPVCWSPRVDIPLTAGLFRPFILLPEAAQSWSADRLRLVLLHEIAHIARRDCLAQFVIRLVRCLYWFHPLVWVAVRRHDLERERACDDRVLAHVERPSDYARHLVDIARGARRVAWPAAGVAMAATSQLESRLHALLVDRRRSPLTRAGRAAVLLVAAMAVLPLGFLRAQDPPGTVSGTVHDPSLAVVPGATVELADPGGENRRATTSEPDGEFRFHGVPAGRYRLFVSKPGFRYYVSPILVLNGDRSHRGRVVLDLGGVFEEMEVRSAGRPVARMEPRHVRVGGHVEPPRIVRKANPRYPEAAKAEGIEGDVVLRAVILMSGELGSVTVVESPAPVLSEGAIDAVKKWQFQPGLLNGQPVELSTQITIKFRLGE